jgi:hypothetical protein
MIKDRTLVSEISTISCEYLASPPDSVLLSCFPFACAAQSDAGQTLTRPHDSGIAGDRRVATATGLCKRVSAFAKLRKRPKSGQSSALGADLGSSIHTLSNYERTGLLQGSKGLPFRPNKRLTSLRGSV